MSAAISVATDPLREVRVPTASPDDDDGAFALLAIILRALGCDRPPASASDALNARRINAPNPKYILYDAAPDIVEKQLSFRQKRKMDRAASFTSLASLGVVVDFLQRRIEVQFGGGIGLRSKTSPFHASLTPPYPAKTDWSHPEAPVIKVVTPPKTP